MSSSTAPTTKLFVLGRELRVPSGQPLLKSLEQRFPDRVGRGNFCWKHECGSSKFFYKLPGDDLDRKARACRFVPVEGMEITALSAELKWVLADWLAQSPR